MLVARRAEVLAEAVAELGSERAVGAGRRPGRPAAPPSGLRVALRHVRPAGRRAGQRRRPAGRRACSAPPRSSGAGVRRRSSSPRCGSAARSWPAARRPTWRSPGCCPPRSGRRSRAWPRSNGLRPGLGMLVKQLADELGPPGHPGRRPDARPGRDRARPAARLARRRPGAARAAGEAAIPLRRYGRPEEFGRVAAFVLSPAASYLTGCVVPVEGGALRSL